ncbi:MAG: LamG domain-containing protein, partial [Candidatus Paceibacterota bacterium]
HFESAKYQLTQGSDAMYTVGSNLNLAPFLSGLVGWWKFDETGTSTVLDSSGFGVSGIMWQHNTSSVDFHTSSGCKIGLGCFSSNGIDSYAQLATISGMSRGIITATGWVKKTPGNASTVFRTAGNYSYLDFENGPTTLRFGVNAQWSTMHNAGYPDDGGWHFVLGTFDGAVVKRYIDGNFIGQTSYTYSIPFSAATISGDASKFGYGSISGLIDDVRVYNRALSASEISALYNATR